MSVVENLHLAKERERLCVKGMVSVGGKLHWRSLEWESMLGFYRVLFRVPDNEL